VAAVGAAGALLAFQQTQQHTSLAGLVNLACVSWHLEGPCFCNPTTPCVTVSYWEPAWIVETVKKPGTTNVPILGDLLTGVLAAAGVPGLGGGGAGVTSGGTGHTNMQFNDAHVYAYPHIFGGPCTACAPSASPFVLNYASEIDPLWRLDHALPSPLDLLRQLGVWGRLYPRSGKAIHSSEPVGSGIAAARALDIAFNPIGEPPNNEARVVLSPTLGTSSCCQLASPRPGLCMPVGTPPFLWEQATVSPSGSYIWVFWKKRTCCVNPAQSNCGITLLGGHGANTCVLPSLPTP
jgi:hypothetical protein